MISFKEYLFLINEICLRLIGCTKICASTLIELIEVSNLGRTLEYE